MAVNYTTESKFPIQPAGMGNWGAVIAGVLAKLDAGHELTVTAGENIAAGDVVALKSTDGKMYKADNGDLALSAPLGVCPDAVTSGNEGKLRWFGWIDIDTSFSVGDSVSFDCGDLVYAAATPGRVTNIRPLNAAPIGICKIDTDASWDTRILIHPTLGYNRADIKQIQVPIENLAASADIAAREIFVCPMACELVRAGILSQGAASISAINTATIELQDDAANSIVSKTYNDGTPWPDNDYEDLGTLDTTHKILAAGEHVELNVTCEAAADLPAFLIILEYVLRY